MSTPEQQLNGITKILWKPFGLVLGVLSGLVAGKVFGVIWKKVSNEDETPQPLSEDYSTREVLIAAALQGAIFALIKTALDRYGMRGFRKILDLPPPAADRRKAA
jgi:hypothetical protein